MSKGGDWEIVVTGGLLTKSKAEGGAIVLGRLGKGEVGSEGG